MKYDKKTHLVYRFFFWFFRIIFFFYHPSKLIGRENVPEGPCMLCANHSGFADPIWIFRLLNGAYPPWSMGRKSLFTKPLLRKLLPFLGSFPVDRDNPDLSAVKKSLEVLKGGRQLLIFPEGTRVKNGKKSEPKSGAVMLAQRAGVPIVPIYITHGRKPFCRVRVVAGEAYTPEFASRRPSGEELEAATVEMMAKIYALGQGK